MNKINKKYFIIMVIFILIILYVIMQLIQNKNYENIEFEKMENNGIEIKDNVSVDKIVVYITGAINKQGVYELDENSRIKDIIEMAGGLRDDAEIDEINLADMLEDGMKIKVPSKNDKEKTLENMTKENTTSNTNSNIGINKQNTKININTASQQELENLPGIGESTALKIIKYRKEKGNFSKIEDIKNVNGIGDNKFNKIKDLIKV